MEEELSRYFRLMWGNYPGSATLVHKSRRIVAANPAGLAFGKRLGAICSQLGKPDDHRGCLAERVLKERRPMWIIKELPAGRRMVFWLPLDGQPDYYLHFSMNIVEMPQI